MTTKQTRYKVQKVRGPVTRWLVVDTHNRMTAVAMLDTPAEARAVRDAANEGMIPA